MLLLPVAGSFGIRLIPEIILVLRLGQPRPLQRAFPGLAAVRLEAIALACSTPVIGKKKTLAVQALPAGLGRLHRSQSQTEPSLERQGNQRKKIQPQEQSKRRRRKKNFQRILGRKSTGRRSILNRRFCIYSISPLAESRGSTVLTFVMSANGSTPPRFFSSTFKWSSRIQRLFVLKNL